MHDIFYSLNLIHLCCAVVLRVAFDYVRKHSFETVRVIRLARNMGKVCVTPPLLFSSKIPVSAQTQYAICLILECGWGGGGGGTKERGGDGRKKLCRCSTSHG